MTKPAIRSLRFGGKTVTRSQQGPNKVPTRFRKVPTNQRSQGPNKGPKKFATSPDREVQLHRLADMEFVAFGRPKNPMASTFFFLERLIGLLITAKAVRRQANALRTRTLGSSRRRGTCLAARKQATRAKRVAKKHRIETSKNEASNICPWPSRQAATLGRHGQAAGVQLLETRRQLPKQHQHQARPGGAPR